MRYVADIFDAVLDKHCTSCVATKIRPNPFVLSIIDTVTKTTTTYDLSIDYDIFFKKEKKTIGIMRSVDGCHIYLVVLHQHELDLMNVLELQKVTSRKSEDKVFIPFVTKPLLHVQDVSHNFKSNIPNFYFINEATKNKGISSILTIIALLGAPMSITQDHKMLRVTLDVHYLNVKKCTSQNKVMYFYYKILDSRFLSLLIQYKVLREVL